MAWYDKAVIYHIYPLGLCGCRHENSGVAENHFEKLNKWAEHAKKIGCTCIYIGPLFESGSHGYDTINYRKVDKRLGNNKDFRNFISNCHKIGLKVIVDGVFNHVGRNFFAFEDLKKNRENSKYRNWFCNVNFLGNNEYNDRLCYENWGGDNLLVKLNNNNEEVVKYHLDTVKFWIDEFDIDGIRLDVAEVLDFNFMKRLRIFTENLKNDFWLMGEVIHGDYSRWANSEMLHSVTNYSMYKSIYSSHNDHNYFELAHNIKRMIEMTGKLRLYTFVDNHDVSRIYSILKNKEHIYNTLLLQYTIPGIPSIYYGSEFCIEGNKNQGDDWNLRPCLDLNNYKDYYYKNKITNLLCKLGELKANYLELTYGDYKELKLTNRQFAFARILENHAVVTIVNNDYKSITMEIDMPFEVSNAVDILDTTKNNNLLKIDTKRKKLIIDIPSNSGGLLYIK